MAEGKQFMRYISLKVGKGGGSGIELTGLKINFEVTKTASSDPNPAIIKVYNLNQDTRNSILYEYDTVELEAGYVNGNKGLIFHGNISEITETRKNYVDIITEIKAEDGGNAYKYSTTSRSVAAGATDEDLLSIVLDDYSKFDVGEGSLDRSLLSNVKYSRGVTLHTNTREIADKIAANHGLEISVQDNQLQLLQAKYTLEIPAEMIGSKYGLVDPGVRFNEKGIQFRTLLNTNLRVGGAVKVEEEAYTTRYVNKLDKTKNRLPQSGSVFKLIEVKHSGDTHENAWYSDCSAVNYTSEATDQKDMR